MTISSVGETESLPGGGDGQYPAFGQRGAQLLDVYARGNCELLFKLFTGPSALLPSGDTQNVPLSFDINVLMREC